MLRAFLAVAAIAVPTFAYAGEGFCNNSDRFEFTDVGVVKFTVNGVSSVWTDAGSLGTEVPGRLYGNVETNEEIGILADSVPGNPDAQIVTRNGKETVYKYCTW
jgi:hypothetical protein